MIGKGFGKGQGFTHKATNALTKGAVPTLLVSGQSGFLANKMMGALREDGLISLPEIAVRSAATIGTWNGLPQPTTSVGTAVTKHEGDNLTGAAAQSCPQPDGVVLARDEGPQLIDFQHVSALLGQQTVRQAWQALHLGTNPFHRGLASHPVNMNQSPQAGPLRIAAQHVFTALSLIAWFWLKHAIRSTVLAVVLRLTNLIRPILDDVLAAAHSAFVCLGHLDHPAYSGLSLTTFPPPSAETQNASESAISSICSPDEKTPRHSSFALLKRLFMRSFASSGDSKIPTRNWAVDDSFLRFIFSSYNFAKINLKISLNGSEPSCALM